MDTLNSADNLIFQTGKSLTDLEDKISEEQKTVQIRYADRLKGPTILGNIDLSK